MQMNFAEAKRSLNAPATCRHGGVKLLVGLQVVLQHIVSRALAAPVADHSCRALDNLPGLALLVNLAKAGPLPKLHVGVNLDQGDTVLLAESSDQLLVHWLVTVI